MVCARSAPRRRGQPADLFLRQRCAAGRRSLPHPLLPHRLRWQRIHLPHSRRRYAPGLVLTGHELSGRRLLYGKQSPRCRIAQCRRRQSGDAAGDSRYQSSGSRRLESPRSIYSQGPRRENGHVGIDCTPYQFRPEPEVPGDRIYLPRPRRPVCAQNLHSVQLVHDFPCRTRLYRRHGRWNGNLIPFT